MDDKEILRRVIQGFQLVPAKRGFGHPYVTKTGAATPDLSKRINAWIKQNFPQSNIMTSYEGVYKAINFRRAMNENRIRLVDLFEIEGPTRTPKNRIVYAWTFPEQNLAYIGLTGDERKRSASHRSLKAQKTTAVSRYIRETGLTPEYKVVSKTEENPSGQVDEDKAVELECYFMAKYKADGWDLLNLAPCGSKGGGVRDEIAIINALDDFIHSTGTELNTLNTLPGSDYTVDAIKNYNLGDRVFNRLKDIVTANNITSTKQLRSLTSRRVSKLIEDWSSKFPEDSWQRKLFPENTRGLEKPQEGIESFLAEPSNLSRDQLKLITKRAWKGVKPEQEKAFLTKLKGIMDKNNVTDPAGLDQLAGNTTVTWMLSDHDKNSDKKWKPLLYRADYKSPKSKASVSESTVGSREILKRIIKSCCSK
jgi:hypothetical protein